jgi:hypothetical protein
MFCGTIIGLKHTAFFKHIVSFLELETYILATKGAIGTQTEQNTTNLMLLKE